MSRAGASDLGWSFRHVESTGSTNADLVEEARAGDRSWAVLTADHQRAGRGRLDRSWHDDGQGQLMVSLRIPVDLAQAVWVTGAVAAAARSATASLGAVAGFKWPNDLLLDIEGSVGKLAGVLAELVPGSPDVVVVGLGLNVASPGFEGAVSLREAGVEVTRDDVLAALLRALPERLSCPELVRRELRLHSLTIGQRVRLERCDGNLTGDAVDIDEHGRLMLDVDGERHAVTAGDVVHLRRVED